MARRPPDAVVVTGAGRGIGRAIALDLGAAGLPVLCISRTPTAQATADAVVAGGGSAEALMLDLADAVSTEAGVSRWIEGTPYRRLGVVLAAGELGPQGPTVAVDLGAWAHTFAVNLLGNLAVVRAMLPRMVEGGGRIIFFGGGGAASAYPIFPAYATSKAAVVRATENLGEELRDHDIAVVCVAPGAVDTDMLPQVIAAGAEVRTRTAIDEVVGFANAFLHSRSRALSGRFVHVRDDWKELLDGTAPAMSAEMWKLRRVQ